METPIVDDIFFRIRSFVNRSLKFQTKTNFLKRKQNFYLQIKQGAFDFELIYNKKKRTKGKKLSNNVKTFQFGKNI